VTITGPGGIGKTRFALQVAAELIQDFRDGVWWVGLAPLRDHKLVLPAISAAVGANGELEQEFRAKELLVLLDNFEHVVGAARDAADLQLSCPNVVLLVTSREPLHIAGEREHQLSPLPESPAVELFRQRAAAIRPTFDADYRMLAELCDRIDRLPLAIELAAARTRSLSVESLLERIDERLPLLTSRRRDVDERQQTLRATIEWSYDLLDDNDRELFTRLSVFAGSFDATAAQAVCNADLDTLESLVDKSLLRGSQEGRFFMLETIREFAQQALDLEARHEVEHRHADYYLSFAERMHTSVRNGDLRQALSDLDLERENIRRALSSYQTSGDAVGLARLIDAFAHYWFVRGQFREADRWVQRALTGCRPAEPRLVVGLLVCQSDSARMLGDLSRALASAQEAVGLSRTIGDDRLVGRSLHELGESFAALGDVPAATAAYTDAVAAARRAGQSPVSTLGNLADLALSEGDFEEAARRLQEVRAQLADEEGDIALRLINDHNFVVALLHLDRGDEAKLLLKDVLPGLRDLGYLDGVACALLASASALMAREGGRTAARIFGAAERILHETGVQIGPTERRLSDSLTAFIAERGLEEARSSGRELSTEDAVQLAVRSLD
jgi:predicted ATPase